MNRKAFFSIIELMTVVLVVLLLITLLIPTFSRLKMNARTSICKNQMRQIGVLINSYSSEHNGFLPNDNELDIPPNLSGLSGPKNNNNNFYANWTGHLLPYLDSQVKTYTRYAALRKAGEVYTYDWVYKKNTGTTKPTNILDNGWIVVKDAFENGGYNDLKIFICPEIHSNTYDVGVSDTYLGLKVPRINELSQSLSNTSIWALGGGIPTTYMANDIFFGFDGPYMNPPNSLRVDQISNMANKALIVEGGVADASKCRVANPQFVYYRVAARGDLGIGEGIWKKAAPWIDGPGGHKFSYVHDTGEPFWLMNCYLYNYFPYYNMPWNAKTEIANKFNIAFSGKASMIAGVQGYSIISYIDPIDKPFDKFFIANPPGVPLLPFDSYDEPEWHYLTGNMNVLFGDGSVVTKDQTWLSMNKEKIGQITNE